MTITNNYNLPKALYRAVALDTHKAGGDFSTTQLLKSPREIWLTIRHGEEARKDAISLMWALVGTSIHSIAERGEDINSLVEEYMKMEFNGVTLTGMLDIFEDGILWDYKSTSVYGIKNLDAQKKAQYMAQLNIYAYMFSKLTTFKVRGLRILAIMRDWVASKAQFNKDYFDFQAQVLEIPLLSEEQQLELILNRINYIMSFKDTPDDELPLCSDAYRWVKPSKWALMKQGRKSAVKLYSSEEEAKNNMTDPKHYIEERKEEQWKHCEYCPACNFCNQTQYNEKNWRREHKNIIVNMSYNELIKETKKW